jgi:hypothetical protein
VQGAGAREMKKRPRDPAQLAKLMIDIASGEVEDREPTRHSVGGCPGRCGRLPHWELTLPAFQVDHIQPGSTPRA